MTVPMSLNGAFFNDKIDNLLCNHVYKYDMTRIRRSPSHFRTWLPSVAAGKVERDQLAACYLSPSAR